MKQSSGNPVPLLTLTCSKRESGLISMLESKRISLQSDRYSFITEGPCAVEIGCNWKVLSAEASLIFSKDNMPPLLQAKQHLSSHRSISCKRYQLWPTSHIWWSLLQICIRFRKHLYTFSLDWLRFGPSFHWLKSHSCLSIIKGVFQSCWRIETGFLE